MGSDASLKKRRQGGGFYPSVYGGVTGASMLAPLVARQTLRLYNDTALYRKSKKSKKSKKSRKSKRKQANRKTRKLRG